MPGRICAVPCCTNTAVSVKNAKGKDITFHNFPSNPEIRRMWYKAINKCDDWIPRKILAVCSSHFTPDSFSRSEKRTFLKRTAVPSVWGPVSSRKVSKLTERCNPLILKNVPRSARKKHLSDELTKSTATPSKRATLDLKDSVEKDCVLKPVSANVIFLEEPVPQPVSFSSSTRDLEIDSSLSYEASFSRTQESEEMESEDGDVEGFFVETTPYLEDKYLVFVSQLLLLFKFCRRPDCQKPIVYLARKVSGTCLTVKTECLEGHEDTWESQPRFGLTSWGNYLLAASIFFSGEIPSKFLNVFKNMNIRVFSTGMYFVYQRIFHPIIEKFWVNERETLLCSNASKKYTLCGHSRADSPGVSSNYGTYTFMDAETKKILHVELLQSTEVISSNNMELEGLKRGLKIFSNMLVGITKIFTNPNQEVIAYLRDKHSNIIHVLNNWNVAKSIKSKLVAIGKKKSYDAINLWIPAITNHIYWIGVSSKTRDERKDKWLAILNHITDVHEGHGPEFPKCLHGPIENKDTRIWLERGTKLFDEVSEVIKSPSTLAAIYELSSEYQTYSIEVFHSVLNSFCPKMHQFTKDSVKSRIYLAALHYNENCENKQALTGEGEEQYYISYLKAKASTTTGKTDLVESTYDYVEKLLQVAYEQAVLHPVGRVSVTSLFSL